MEEVIVTHCGNCPFVDEVTECSVHDGKLDVYSYVADSTMPNSCPLLVSEVVVKVNMNE